MATKKVATTTSLRKNCEVCGRSKLSENFYKTNSTLLFPDGRLNVCNDCIKEKINFSDINVANDFLRQMDMPFVAEAWEYAVKKIDGHPLSNYLRTMHTIKYRDLRYADSDSLSDSSIAKSIKDDSGEIIKITDDIMTKWGTDSGYTIEDYLKLEKFYRNMKYVYEINTPAQDEMLLDLSRLNIKKEQLLSREDFTGYDKISKAFNNTLKDAGFRPVDKKNNLDEAGITSFGQIVQQIERDGFIPPRMVEFEKDDVDMMLLYYLQWVQRFTERAVSVDAPEDWREDVDKSVDIATVDEQENIADAETDYAEEAIKAIENELGTVSDENE